MSDAPRYAQPGDPPGWYSDPAAGETIGQVRWWDGKKLTDDTAMPDEVRVRGGVRRPEFLVTDPGIERVVRPRQGKIQRLLEMVATFLSPLGLFLVKILGYVVILLVLFILKPWSNTSSESGESPATTATVAVSGQATGEDCPEDGVPAQNDAAQGEYDAVAGYCSPVEQPATTPAPVTNSATTTTPATTAATTTTTTTPATGCAEVQYDGRVTVARIDGIAPAADVVNEVRGFVTETCGFGVNVSWMGVASTDPSANNPNGELCLAAWQGTAGTTGLPPGGTAALSVRVLIATFEPWIGAFDGPTTCQEIVDRDEVGSYLPAWADGTATATVTDQAAQVTGFTATNEYGQVLEMEISLTR